jgi:hypothetical protein
MSLLPSRLRDALLFVAGGSVGGLALFAVGYQAMVVEGSGPLRDAWFFVGLAAFLGSFVAPLALVQFLCRRWTGAIEDFFARSAAFAVNVVFLFLLGGVGAKVVSPLVDRPARGMFAFLDGVFGFVWGGIIVLLVAEHLRGGGTSLESGL